jgi:plasmid stabilization system protein ParE
MKIIHKPNFSEQLKQILSYIAHDNPQASVRFKNGLKESIYLLPDNPYKYRQSIYFDSPHIRDMIYRVKPIKETIEVLRIFNQNKPH